MNINPVKAFSDNYIWVIDNGTDGIIVDPGESAGVLDYFDKRSIGLSCDYLNA